MSDASRDAQARHESSLEMQPLDHHQSSSGHEPREAITVEDSNEERERQLAELRRQLSSHYSPRPRSNTAEYQAVQADNTRQPDAGSSGDASPQTRLSARRKRHVQWVGVQEADEQEDDVSARRLGSDHVLVPMPEDMETANGLEGASDGSRTPATMPNTPDVSRPPSPVMTAQIPSGERDGLPISASAAKRNRTFTREAAKLVAVHSAKDKFLAGRDRRRHTNTSDASDRPSSAKSMRVNHRAAGALYDDEEAPRPVPPQQATGVLSALLRLYENPSARSSNATLVASRPESPHDNTTASHVDSHPQPPAPTPASSRISPTASLADRRNAHMQLPRALKNVAQRVQDYREDRPSTARSEGGVFGALQASAFSLGGAATPTGVSVTPAATRPGFRVARHSMPAVPTRMTVSEGNSRAPSRQASPDRSAEHSPELRSGLRHGHGSHASLNKLPQTLYKLPEKAFKTSEAWSKDHLDPKRYYRESNAYRNQKSLAASDSQPGTPRADTPTNDYFGDKTKRRKRDKKRQDEIFITMHVAAILQRQDFVLRLARALMMFGAPPHRLENQLQQTAKVLELDCSCIFIVNFCIIAFNDASSHTSEIKFIKQSAGLDLSKLTDLAILHYEVMHDKIGVEAASEEISALMLAKPYLKDWMLVLVGAAAAMTIGIAAFNASFIDLLVAAPLGALLVAVQLFIAARSDVLSSIFEMIIAAIISFVAAAAASSERFCFAAIVSSAIVLVLPGWPSMVAALELQSRSLVSGSVRLVYAIVYSLFLGFGISLGANFWVLVSGHQVVSTGDGSCSVAHPAGSAWYQQTIPQWFFFLAVPGFPLTLALRNGARPSRELVVMILISGAGWSVNRWSALGFPGRSDITAALGAVTVGLLGNFYGKLFQSTSFIVTLVPILFQLPSGLGNGGLLNFATTESNSTQIISSGFNVAQQLITVVIGLSAGLLIATALSYPFGKRRGGLMAF